MAGMIDFKNNVAVFIQKNGLFRERQTPICTDPENYTKLTYIVG